MFRCAESMDVVVVVERLLLPVSTFAEAPGFLGFGAHWSDLVQFVARDHRSHHELLHKLLHLTESAKSLEAA